MLSQPKVLLVGWDGAGWKHIHPLLDSGAMPNLSRLIENGVMGDLAPLTPFCSPLLWTSLSTGQFADRHGVLDWNEDDPKTGGARPVTRQSLQVQHVWEMLSEQGVSCQAIGWPATHPAASAKYVCVSDRFAVDAADSVCAEGREAELRSLRFDAAEWTGADLKPFVPELGTINQDRDRRLAKLAVLLAETASNHAAATALLESNPCDLTVAWYGAAARAQELFPADTDLVYAEVVNGVYRFLDLMLGRLVQLAGAETLIMLVSDRTAGERELHPGSARDAQGILVAAGPGVKVDELAYGAGALDIAPTLLALFGYRQPAAMPGHAIEEISSGTPTRELKISQVTQSSGVEQEDLGPELQELQELGYQDVIAAHGQPEAAKSRSRRTLNLARVLMSQDRVREAVPVLEESMRVDPDNSEAKLQLAHAYLLSGKVAASRQLAEELMAKHPDSPMAALAKAHLAIAEGNPVAAQQHLQSGRGMYGISAALDTAVGQMYLRLKNWAEATLAFESALGIDPQMPGAYAGIAEAMLGAARFEESAEAAMDAVRLRYNMPEAHDTLGKALLAMGREEAAANAFAVKDGLLRIAANAS